MLNFSFKETASNYIILSLRKEAVLYDFYRYNERY